MMDIVLRVARETDGAALEQLELHAWHASNSPDPEYSGPVFGKRIPFDDVIVASSESGLLGYVAIGRRTRFAGNAHIGVLRAIVVAPQQQRRGVGTRLIARAEQEARRRGFRALRLSVMASNVQALALYQRAGFRELGRYPDEFQVEGGYVDDIFLGKLL